MDHGGTPYCCFRNSLEKTITLPSPCAPFKWTVSNPASLRVPAFLFLLRRDLPGGKALGAKMAEPLFHVVAKGLHTVTNQSMLLSWLKLTSSCSLSLKLELPTLTHEAWRIQSYLLLQPWWYYFVISTIDQSSPKINTNSEKKASLLPVKAE